MGVSFRFPSTEKMFLSGAWYDRFVSALPSSSQGKAGGLLGGLDCSIAGASEEGPAEAVAGVEGGAVFSPSHAMVSIISTSELRGWQVEQIFSTTRHFPDATRQKVGEVDEAPDDVSR